MSRKFLLSASMLALAAGALVSAGAAGIRPDLRRHPGAAAIRRPRAAVHQERRVADQRRRRKIHPLFAARSDQRVELQQARSGVALQDRRLRSLSGIQARGHADHGQGRALHHRRHAALGGRDRCQDRRTDLVAQPARGRARRRIRRGSCRGAAFPTGPTGAATTASSMSRPASGWSSSMPRPAP